jgi:hypothetical protein
MFMNGGIKIEQASRKSGSTADLEIEIPLFAGFIGLKG